MKKRDYAKLSMSMARFSENINDENKERLRQIRELEGMKVNYDGFSPVFFALFADIFKDFKKMELHHLVSASNYEEKQIRQLMKNAEDRLKIIEEAEKNGLVISNEKFEKGIYSFVASSENIEFKKDEDMKKIIDKLESKYGYTMQKEDEETSDYEA